MLVDDAAVLQFDPILAILACGKAPQRIEQGVCVIRHFGSSDFMSHCEHYPDLSIDPYGVCDSIEQLKKECPELSDPSRQFVVTLSEVRRDEQPPEGGWRWHKWGEYIGDKSPQHEYLYDEQDIDMVYCYHIYERV